MSPDYLLVPLACLPCLPSPGWAASLTCSASILTVPSFWVFIHIIHKCYLFNLYFCSAHVGLFTMPPLPPYSYVSLMELLFLPCHLLGHSSYFSDRACPVSGWCPGLSSTLGNSSERYFLILFFPLFPTTTCSSLSFFVLPEYISLLSALTVEGTAFSYSVLCAVLNCVS